MGQQPCGRGLEPEPLPVLEVGRPGSAAQAQRVGHVLDELERPAQARAPCGRPGGEPVERLRDRVAVGRRGRAVNEARGDQLDPGAAAGERGGQGVVVRQDVCRGIDELNAHGTDILNH